MVGEVVAGAVQGVAQTAMQTAVEMPVAAVASAGVVAASIPQAASVVAETTATVTKGLEAATRITAPLGEAMNTASQSPSLGLRLSGIAHQQGSHMALTQLAFGDVSGKTADVVAQLPERIMQQDFINLEKMGPQAVQGLTQEVGALGLGQEIANNPEFLQKFAEEFGKDVAEQKALLQEGKLTPDEYMAMRKSLLEKSAGKAFGKTEKSDIQEKDLERIKREAALQAIRQHMNLWRMSVRVDKRLSPEAKQHALHKIDVFEQKVLLKEVVKWDGVSIMSLIALATVWMQEVGS